MIGRKIIYTVDFVHILTFQAHYREIIAPFFIYENLEYAIENENTINEGIRLIYTNEDIIIFVRKEGLVFLFEGNVDDLLKSNAVVSIFFEILEAIKKITGWTKITKQKTQIDSVLLISSEGFEVEKYFSSALKIPYKNVKDLNIQFEFEYDDKLINIKIGNFNGNNDVKKFDLSPLKTTYNRDLKNSIGIFSQVIISDTSTPSFSRLKTFIRDTKEVNNQYLEALK